VRNLEIIYVYLFLGQICVVVSMYTSLHFISHPQQNQSSLPGFSLKTRHIPSLLFGAESLGVNCDGGLAKVQMRGDEIRGLLVDADDLIESGQLLLGPWLVGNTASQCLKEGSVLRCLDHNSCRLIFGVEEAAGRQGALDLLHHSWDIYFPFELYVLNLGMF